MLKPNFEEADGLGIGINILKVGFPLSRDFSNFQVPGLSDLLSPGTTGPSRSLGPVLSCPVLSCWKA